MDVSHKNGLDYPREIAMTPTQIDIQSLVGRAQQDLIRGIALQLHDLLCHKWPEPRSTTAR